MAYWTLEIKKDDKNSGKKDGYVFGSLPELCEQLKLDYKKMQYIFRTANIYEFRIERMDIKKSKKK